MLRRVVLQGVGKQGRSTSGSTPVVHDGNALVSMQTGRTPPYLTHNRILTWEVADGTLWVRRCPLLRSSPRRGYRVRPPKVARDRDRDLDRALTKRVPGRSPPTPGRPISKERPFRSIPEIYLFFRSCRSRLIDRDRTGRSSSSAVAFYGAHRAGERVRLLRCGR